MSISELVEQRRGLCVAGRCVEPSVSSEQLVAALCDDETIESFRPLLPVGYDVVAESYRRAANTITTADLTNHYTSGMETLKNEFVPWLRNLLTKLSGGAWKLDDYVAYASGSDVDLMAHLIEFIAARDAVYLYPGDWYGFLVGSSQQQNIHWRNDASGGTACLCIPSVRNGHVADDMIRFLESASSCLLNLNLYPTLADSERHEVSTRLASVLPKSVLSISFSRGFGLTASQLGIFLIHKDHPLREKYDQQWNWFTYFYNAIATRTFQDLDLSAVQAVDQQRRQWVSDWLGKHELPDVTSGSYYVKSFAVRDPENLPARMQKLVREDVLRLCFKPPIF